MRIMTWPDEILLAGLQSLRPTLVGLGCRHRGAERGTQNGRPTPCRPGAWLMVTTIASTENITRIAKAASHKLPEKSSLNVLSCPVLSCPVLINMATLMTMATKRKLELVWGSWRLYTRKLEVVRKLEVIGQDVRALLRRSLWMMNGELMSDCHM